MNSNTEFTAWTDVTVNNWDELIQALHSQLLIPLKKEQGGHRRSSFVFRGMSCAAWPLMTSLERLGTAPEKVEQGSLRSFGKYAPVGTFSPHSEWERLAVAQHNGLPTRVLDWAVSPLVAAHFATSERKHRDDDGVIWCVNADSVRDNLLPQEMRGHLFEAQAFVYNVPLLDKKFPELRTFDATEGEAGDLIIFLEPPSIDARIQNQFGILSVMNGPAKSHDSFLRKCSQEYPGMVQRIVIKHEAKAEIRDMLDQNNITERMLFPGLPGLCDWLRRYYGPV
ncbi:MAG TPA: FRG domain-containing protein [Pyrinomonadaceae bacterium]|nr:FRG domain-containing protein [Pyrinomonadaceae bacterium]